MLGAVTSPAVRRFLSTLSLRRATLVPHQQKCCNGFLSTLSLRRATVFNLGGQDITVISIHALLAESDIQILSSLTNTKKFLSTLSLRRATTRQCLRLSFLPHFYPRSPCGERPSRLHKNICGWGFLSTLSLRRATHERHRLLPVSNHFYPRSPCGERQLAALAINPITKFLSTLSLRRATQRWGTPH